MENESSWIERWKQRKLALALHMVMLFCLLAIGPWLVMRHRTVFSSTRSTGHRPPTPSVAWTNVREYLAHHETKGHEKPFPESVLAFLTSRNVHGRYSVYLEDLTTGDWWGINESQAYNPWSLLKVPVLVDVLRKVEMGQVSPEDTIPLVSTNIQNNPANGEPQSIKALAEKMIELSDDQASITLGKLIPWTEFQESLQAMGLPRSLPNEPMDRVPIISPKQYANLLRSLYYSSYLKKPLSELVLSLLSSTKYDNQIRAGIPADVSVAHKVGFDSGTGEFHDCGIVYLPGRPYMLCLMSTNNTYEESNYVISMISKEIYEFMSSTRYDDGE
jgi:beta-lactamase class A